MSVHESTTSGQPVRTIHEPTYSSTLQLDLDLGSECMSIQYLAGTLLHYNKSRLKGVATRDYSTCTCTCSEFVVLQRKIRPSEISAFCRRFMGTPQFVQVWLSASSYLTDTHGKRFSVFLNSGVGYPT